MKQENFNYIKIKLASPRQILKWSTRKLPNGQFIGEVQKSDTINYRTFRPEMDGLFCERIFGPIASFECACGKYKRIRYEGLFCERCGVELTESRVRRHRMGYIHLIYPVAHVWYINSRPNYMALLLEVEDFEKNYNTAYTIFSKICNKCYDLKPTTATIINLWDERIIRIKLAALIYFISDDEISFYGLHWDLQQYRKSRIKKKSDYPLKPFPKPINHRADTPDFLLNSTPTFIIGTPLIQRELDRLNLIQELFQSRYFVNECMQVLNLKSWKYMDSLWFRKWEKYRILKLRENTIKRLRLIENLIGTGSNPAWMVFNILPVIPPSLRPMIQLEGGQFATSDLNELYRRIINRNNRLLRLLEIDAPQLIIRNEKRMLQEAIDTLIDNGKRGKIALSANNRPLKSLSDIIKGKYGRFRQNLLGKRVDYSGRSVIVVGPSLKLNQCALPYEMIIELFLPFIIKEIINHGLASNIKTAKTLINQNGTIILPILKKVLKNHPVFLNRAPTLHRLGIQAFEPIITKGKAIKLHPLVCSAFNADFDGDQMAVHIPLSLEAQAECYMLLLAPQNFLSPANGDPIILPSQDMVLGCYYLTLTNMTNLSGSGHYFSSFEHVLLAYNYNQLELHSSIWIKYKNIDKNFINDLKPIKKFKLKDESYIEYYHNFQIRRMKDNTILVKYIQTTTGRVILNYTIQKTLKLL